MSEPALDYYAGISEVTEGNINNPELTDAWMEDLPQPRLWRVVVMPLVPEEKSKGGIFLPDGAVETQKHLTYIGKVVAVGTSAFADKRFEKETPPEIGSYISFGKYAGQAMIFKGTKLLIVNDDEILADVPNPDTLTVHF